MKDCAEDTMRKNEGETSKCPAAGSFPFPFQRGSAQIDDLLERIFIYIFTFVVRLFFFFWSLLRQLANNNTFWKYYDNTTG